MRSKKTPQRTNTVGIVFTFCIVTAFFAEVLMPRGIFQTQKNPSHFFALSLNAPITKFADGVTLKPEFVSQLLYQSKYEPLSSLNGPVEEPPLPVNIPPNIDTEKYGEGKSHFLVDSKWATIRFIGPHPAGAGLLGDELNKAQLSALGQLSDTIPVTTAVATVNTMMDKYFVPLLSGLPGGEEILDHIKVQGAYFSPEHIISEHLDTSFDNAFIYNLQTLLIYPSSCFKNPAQSNCKPPFFSTGHDPTVIGHELSHVIFNHLRAMKSLEGFEWFAVNEGFADYFSAAYFSEPVLGRIWRSNSAGEGYLRKLIDSPTTENPAFLQEGHLFGVIFSSALWRARARIIAEQHTAPLEVDRVFLQSIVFLGETEKTRLADAATAILKASEILGHPEWKTILREEFKKAEISISELPSFTLAAMGPDIEFGKTSSSAPSACGVINQKYNKKDLSKSTGIFLLFAPVGLFLIFQIRTKRKDFFFPILAFLFLQGCHVNWLFPNKETAATPPGISLLYSCFPNVLDSPQSATLPENRIDLSLTWLTSDSPSSPTQHILVSDLRYERAPSALVVVVDKSKHHVDQVRTRKGGLFEIDMQARSISYEDSIAFAHMRLAELILQKSVVASIEHAAVSAPTGTVAFLSDGHTLEADIANPLYGSNSYGPLPRNLKFIAASSPPLNPKTEQLPICSFVRKDEAK